MPILRHLHVSSSRCLWYAVGKPLSIASCLRWLTYSRRLSAANNARIYISQHGDAHGRFPLHWTISNHNLDGPMMADAFFLYALLCDHDEHTHASPFVLRNDTDHDTRIELALQARNQSMVGPGQEEWSHVCNRCCEIKMGADGQTCVSRSGLLICRCTQYNCRHNARGCHRWYNHWKTMV